MGADPADLGPFSPATGRADGFALAAVALAGGALAAAIARPVAVAGGAELRRATPIAVMLGAAAALTALVAMYRVAARGRRGRGLARAALAVGTLVAVWSFMYGAARDGAIRLGRFLDLYFDEEIIRAIGPDLLRGGLNTIEAAFVAEALAIAVGLVVASLELSRNRLLRYPAFWYVDVVRGLPLVVLTTLIYFGLTYIGITLSPFAAVIASLTVNASAYVAETFRAGMQSVPRGQMDAARSLGMPQATAMTFVVIPQAVRSVIPPLMSEFIALVKDTAVVFLVVGVTAATADLYNVARTGAASTFSPTPFMAAAVVYLAITLPATRLVGFAERRLRAGLT